MEAKYRHKRLPRDQFSVACKSADIPDWWGKKRTISTLTAMCVPYTRAYTDVDVYERGGITYCQLVEDGEVVAQGVAYCGLKDNFCYRVGRDIARGRAEKQLGRTNHGV